ncbi:flagellar protein FlaG [Bosea rubneri]|uniref:Flagellar protein FlaG n=1 Tax=Bosea rubneri TaxID=3075434 RepID=A0ABU3S5H0_9HYPH|nr:flagellar protein FlaG [Bosea sp. ZW T0_25]MDU0339672.1 flagellar protein FlaG [Bosea sp. ZW T0_25]
MDFGGAPRMIATGAAQATVRTDIAIQPGSAPVELPAEKTVQSAAAGEALQLDIRARANEKRQEQAQYRQNQDDAVNRERTEAAYQKQERREAVDRRLVIDSKTHSIVLQKTDPDTGETVEQLPDETMLKLRAFSRDLIERARETTMSSSHVVERTA